MPRLEVYGLEELAKRMEQWPTRFQKSLRSTLEAALLVVWENIPSYPPKPANSTYRRTGTLGRSLGSSFSGGKSGQQPDIYETKDRGARMVEASFGTRLEYAPHVIGESQSAYNRHWWTLTKTVLQRIRQPIQRLFESMADEITRWLDGKGRFRTTQKRHKAEAYGAARLPLYKVRASHVPRCVATWNNHTYCLLA